MNLATVYRKILTPETHRMVIDIPEEFRGRSVEIIVLPVMDNYVVTRNKEDFTSPRLSVVTPGELIGFLSGD